jgi:hypothetical protein
MDAAQDEFRAVLLTVVGAAFRAAGYELADAPMAWAGGQYRFVKIFDDGVPDGVGATIEFQHLAYRDTEWASGNPSRFRVTLSRSDGPRRDLSALVVSDFGVAILPSERHWWTYRTLDELGRGLAEAGHLIVGYGLPWLSGDLVPPNHSSHPA